MTVSSTAIVAAGLVTQEGEARRAPKELARALVRRVGADRLHLRVAVGESSVTLLTPPCSIHIESHTTGTGLVPSNDSLADG